VAADHLSPSEFELPARAPSEHGPERSRRNHFAALTLDRLGEVRNEFRLDAHIDTTLWLSARGDGRLLLRQTERGYTLWTHTERTDPALPWCLLGQYEGRTYLLECLTDDQTIESTDDATWVDLRLSAESLPPFEAGLAAYARALVFWRGRHRFCGRCGAPTEAHSAGHRLLCTRPDCASEHFPRIDPAIIVAITHQHRLLLARQTTWPARRYSVLAGFVEPGETLEDCVRREVMEEAGLRLANCHYHSSQPWPFPSALMIGFTADAIDEQIVLGPELETADWFDPQTLVAAVRCADLQLPTAFSVSRRLIEDWYEGQTGRDLNGALAAS
jgi:NAD+ diphosphatase